MRLPRFRFLILLALALLLSMGFDWESIETQYSKDQRIAKVTWAAACRISHYEYCPKKGPSVRRSPILGELENARGIYWSGQPVVWLDTKLKGTQAWLTTFHEQVHWIQVANGVDSGGHTLDCIIEREALDFTNQYARELGRPDLQRTLEVWRTMYSCKVTPSFMGHSTYEKVLEKGSHTLSAR